jgi:hypothetical protein
MFLDKNIMHECNKNEQIKMTPAHDEYQMA